ncbi:hypothetical protein B0H10DRAFT_2097746 [Mycena sp. CBHHK59/15]|nr:hypothetical protein B0H10DRAFT_2097746 [Mycena sp. CBHHK59/15]
MKPEQEFFDVTTRPLTEIPIDSGELHMRSLALDSDTKDETMILYHSPGSEWGHGASITHEYLEECLILKGRIFDVTLGKWFSAGHYCSRPVGMVHGPYRADPVEGAEEIVFISYPTKSGYFFFGDAELS